MADNPSKMSFACARPLFAAQVGGVVKVPKGMHPLKRHGWSSVANAPLRLGTFRLLTSWEDPNRRHAGRAVPNRIGISV